MPNPNKMRDSISTITHKIRKDMGTLSAQYHDLSGEINKRFREELREQKGSMDGLEDFYQLSVLVKRNAQVANHMLGMLSKLTDISGYNITEEIEKDDVEDLIEELTESK